jgi:hypothetical protein
MEYKGYLVSTDNYMNLQVQPPIPPLSLPFELDSDTRSSRWPTRRSTRTASRSDRSAKSLSGEGWSLMACWSPYSRGSEKTDNPSRTSPPSRLDALALLDRCNNVLQSVSIPFLSVSERRSADNPPVTQRASGTGRVNPSSSALMTDGRCTCSHVLFPRSLLHLLALCPAATTKDTGARSSVTCH